MSSEWAHVRLGELAEVKHGWAFKSDYFKADDEVAGLPIVVAIGNFQYTGGFRFESTQIKRYTGEFPSEYILRPGEILLVMTCQTAGGEILGIPARIPDNGRVYLHNQRLGKVVLKSDRVRSDFLYWLFLYPSFNRHLVNSATGTKILHTAPSRIESFEFKLPSVAEQREIAEALDAIDERISLLRETNATLEAIAQALFKSWFIDFEPVHAKQEGRASESMDETTAALFPGGFEESELGLVPRGWRVGAFGDLATLVRGSVNPLDSPSRKFEHYSLPAFDVHRLPVLELGASIKSNKTRISSGVVLQSKLNPHIPRVWFPQSVGAAGICSTEFLPWLAKAPASPEVVCCLLRSSAFEAGVRTLVTGTSNSHQRVKSDQVGALRTVIATAGPYAAFTDTVRPLLQRVGENWQLCMQLAALRDALLPRLISGQLRVPEAEALVA